MRPCHVIFTNDERVKALEVYIASDAFVGLDELIVLRTEPAAFPSAVVNYLTGRSFDLEPELVPSRRLTANVQCHSRIDPEHLITRVLEPHLKNGVLVQRYLGRDRQLQNRLAVMRSGIGEER
jgi:hypothetical protein